MSGLRLVQLKEGIIYGPVASRRLGRSLGINVLGAGRKVCTFDCVYCQLRQPRAYAIAYTAVEHSACGRRCAGCHYAQPWPADKETAHELPSVGAILAAVDEAVAANPALDSLTLSGNGEPSVYPEFTELVTGLAALRDRACPGVPLTILSNSSTLWRPAVRRAFSHLDRRIMKLDAGDENTFRRTNRPCPGVQFGEVLEGVRSLGAVTVQTLLVDGSSGNAAPDRVASWLDALAALRPREVQLYSLDRVPTDGTLAVVPRERLATLAADVARRTGADVRVY